MRAERAAVSRPAVSRPPQSPGGPPQRGSGCWCSQPLVARSHAHGPTSRPGPHHDALARPGRRRRTRRGRARTRRPGNGRSRERARRRVRGDRQVPAPRGGGEGGLRTGQVLRDQPLRSGRARLPALQPQARQLRRSRTPTALFYEDDKKGGKRLVGVQWLVYDRDQNLATSDDRPALFGKPFKGPQRGNFPGQPIHYALHLWLWKKNPLGEFETYNPAVSCRPGTVRPTPQV